MRCLIFLANLSSDPVIVVMADSEPPSENPFRHLPIVIILLIIIKVTIIFFGIINIIRSLDIQESDVLLLTTSFPSHVPGLPEYHTVI